MLDFRKVLLALSVAGLGLVGTASAQVPSCTVNTPIEAYVAAEGTTELLPAVSITCNATVPTGAVTFLLTSNVQFTNQAVPHTANIDAAASDGASDVVTSITQPGPNSLQVVFASMSASQTVTFSGLRVNASLSPVSSNITVGISATGVSIGAAGNPAALGFVTKALSAVTATAVGPQSLCTLLPATVTANTTIAITNGFPDSLKSPTEVLNSIQNVQTIAGTQGTRLAVTFSNLNAGVNYYVPLNIAGTGTLALTAYAGPTGATAATPVAAGQPGAGSILVTSTAPVVYYGVTASNPAGTTVFNIPVTQSVPGSVLATSTSPVAASVTLVGATAPAYPGYAGSPAYTSTQLDVTPGDGLLTSCATTLLFPYVVNVAGYDTGIAISNASTGITGTTLTANSGSCSVTFYGGSGVPPVYSTGVIPTAMDVAFTVSSQAPGLSGYAVAVCNFKGAHGYAFITDGFGGGGRGLAADYLAVVMAANGAATTPTF